MANVAVIRSKFGFICIGKERAERRRDQTFGETLVRVVLALYPLNVFNKVPLIHPSDVLALCLFCRAIFVLKWSFPCVAIRSDLLLVSHSLCP
jgi:hypothetical protein